MPLHNMAQMYLSVLGLACKAVISGLKFQLITVRGFRPERAVEVLDAFSKCSMR